MGKLDILYRAAQRSQQTVTLVANQMLRTPPSPLIRAVQVPRGFDVADDYIVEHTSAGDLVIIAPRLSSNFDESFASSVDHP